LYFLSTNKYAPERASAPVIENSYIFPQGTLLADIPRKITPAVKSRNPKTIKALANLPTRSVLEKSNFVFLIDLAGVLTDHATSTECAKKASVYKAIEA
jgi:hypothetical protein